MSSSPEVSVVMGVYNGAAHLRESVESILRQEEVDLEFVIVNDGSTDSTGAILEEYASRDRRVRLFQQENRGLTESLIRGCDEARGEFIARQDADDVALSGRLRSQVSEARASADLALLSCGTRFIGPGGEWLFDVVRDRTSATSDLLTLDISKYAGPSSHGSTMFPVAAYRRAGGYRREFCKAQDMDLWVRLAEIGPHVTLATVLQQTRYSLDGISSGAFHAQLEIGRLILEGARLRRSGHDESSVLQKVEGAMTRYPDKGNASLAGAAYFVGMCLIKRDPRAARRYFTKSLAADPLHLKALIRLGEAALRGVRSQ